MLAPEMDVSSRNSFLSAGVRPSGPRPAAGPATGASAGVSDSEKATVVSVWFSANSRTSGTPGVGAHTGSLTGRPPLDSLPTPTPSSEAAPASSSSSSSSSPDDAPTSNSEPSSLSPPSSLSLSSLPAAAAAAFLAAALDTAARFFLGVGSPAFFLDADDGAAAAARGRGGGWGGAGRGAGVSRRWACRGRARC